MEVGRGGVLTAYCARRTGDPGQSAVTTHTVKRARRSRHEALNRIGFGTNEREVQAMHDGTFQEPLRRSAKERAA